MNSNTASKAKSERNVGLDLLRVVSMLLVVLLHVLGQGGVLGAIDRTAAPDSYNIAWLMETAAYCAVNCYALISGYVGVRSKFKYSSIIALWLQVVFYTVGFTVLYSFIKPEAVSSGAFFTAFFPVMKRAYWYFSAYFCIFFFIPVFNHVVNTMEKKHLRVTVISIIALFSVIYTISRSTVLGSAVADLFVTERGYSPLWLALLYIVGAYISKYRSDFKIHPSICFLIYTVSVIISWVEKLTSKTGILVSYTSPTILIAALALLLGFSALKCQKISRIVTFLSPAAFGVFLIHVNPLVWTNLMKGLFASLADYPAYLMSILVIGAVFTVYAICTAIDLLRHYFFKLLRIKEALSVIESRLIGNFWQGSGSSNNTN